MHTRPTPLTWQSTVLWLAWWLALSLYPLASQAQAYRCGNIYSSAPCTGGQAVEVEPAVNMYPSTTGNATSGMLPASSHQKNYRQEDKETREWQRAERELDKAQAAPPPQRQGRANTAKCEAAKQRIKKIDELARRGGSVKLMERLREDRQNTRDWQFRSGC